MNSKFMVRLWAFAVIALLPLVVASPVMAQEEGVPTVIDSVIAQVNNDVITLSMLKRDMKELHEALVRQRNMPEQQATEEVTKRQPEIIASLINEQLLLQKGKELGLTDEVEAEVNRQMLRIAKEQKIETLEKLEEEMRKAGLDPSAIRQTMRTETMKNFVLGREVDYKIFSSLGSDEVKKYYEANKEKFRRPESITLSEIFLSTAGRSEADVRARAAALVTQARGGADFGALAAANSEREQDGVRVAQQTKGKIGTFRVSDITKEEVAAPLKNLQAGGVSDPIRTDEGYIILRVDERTPAGEPTFNENQVREAMATERAGKEREEYLRTLRKEAFIKIAKEYQDIVQPLLKVESEKPASNSPASPTKNSAEKKSSEKKPETSGNKRP